MLSRHFGLGTAAPSHDGPGEEEDRRRDYPLRLAEAVAETRAFLAEERAEAMDGRDLT